MESMPGKESNPEGIKPPILYHGTVADNIAVFEPRGAENRPYEPPAVYATPHLELAIQSMANFFVSNGGIVDGRRFVCIPMTREAFQRADKGGTVYSLSSETFRINNSKTGFGTDREWISTENVASIEKVRYPSLFDALLQQGVEVYFIEPDMIEKITAVQKSSDPEELKRLLTTLSRAT